MSARMPPRGRLLLVVEDTFAITGRGLIVAPDVDLGPAVQYRILVELRRPDASTCRVDAIAQQPLVGGQHVPDRGRKKHMLLFQTLSKQDVPIGTEVWMDVGP